MTTTRGCNPLSWPFLSTTNISRHENRHYPIPRQQLRTRIRLGSQDSRHGARNVFVESESVHT